MKKVTKMTKRLKKEFKKAEEGIEVGLKILRPNKKVIDAFFDLADEDKKPKSS